MDFINSVCQDYNITDGSITIHCDSKNVITVLENWQTLKMTPKHKNADIISAGLKLRDTIPIDLYFQHVYGHQDTTKEIEKLDPIAKLNVDMDMKAKELAIDIINKKVPLSKLYSHPLSFATCHWNQVIIQQQLSNNLYQHITHNNMYIYWCERGRIQPHHTVN